MVAVGGGGLEAKQLKADLEAIRDSILDSHAKVMTAQETGTVLAHIFVKHIDNLAFPRRRVSLSVQPLSQCLTLSMHISAEHWLRRKVCALQ